MRLGGRKSRQKKLTCLQLHRLESLLSYAAMRRSSTRLARSSAAASAQESDDKTIAMETATTPTDKAAKATRRSTRSSINVVVPIPAENASLDSSLSPSANASSLDGSLLDTPATSVVATPGESDSNRGPAKKRVSASARAQQLRSSALSLGASTATTRKKRSLSEMKTEASTTGLSDADLARELQLQEYGGMDTKHPKLSANGKGKKAVIPDSDDGEIGFDSEVSEESEHVVPQSASRRRPRKSQPQGSLAAGDDMSLHDLDDDYNYSSSNDSLSDAALSEKQEEEQEAAPATRPRRAPASGRRGGRAQRPRSNINNHPYARMGRRVRINDVNHKTVQ